MATIWRCLLALGLMLSAWPAAAQTQAVDGAGTAKLVVGTLRAPPFVLRSDDGQWSGLSVDLWKQIAAEMKVDFEFREYDYDPAGLLLAVERHEIDAAVAAIPITVEGESRFDFSLPYHAAGLAIAVRTEPQRGVLGTLASVFTPQFLAAAGGLLCVLLTVGTLVWLLERRHNAQHFDPRPARGIGDGLWWAAVTMTTTGYGDKVPISWQGRCLGLLWMFASIFIIALFSATMASAFVVNRLKTGVTGPGDLPKARVAVVTGTAGEQWARDQGLQARQYPFVIQASKALQRGDVDALVYERAVVGHMIKQYGWRQLQLLPHTLAVRDHAIALPAESPIKEAVNRALLKVVLRAEWKEVVQRHIGTSESLALAERP